MNEKPKEGEGAVGGERDTLGDPSGRPGASGRVENRGEHFQTSRFVTGGENEQQPDLNLAFFPACSVSTFLRVLESLVGLLPGPAHLGRVA